MKRIWIYLLSVMLITACATGTTVKQAEQAVTASLPRQYDLSVENIEKFPGDVICGEWTGRSRAGEYRRQMPFLVLNGEADPEPSRRRTDFYCNQNPAGWLLDNSGIGPVIPENALLLRTVGDLNTLGAALERYYRDHHKLPTEAEGLKALTQPSRNVISGESIEPYVAEIPADPWGQDYHYARDRLAGVRAEFELFSRGADKQPGGSGDNADVHYRDIEFIDHLLSLQN